MPRGRHRTTLPRRLIAIVASLLVTGGIVVAAGSAFADSGDSRGSGSGLIGTLTGGSDEGSSSSNGSGGSDGSGDANSSDGSNGSGGTEADGRQDGRTSGEGRDGQNADERSGNRQDGENRQGDQGSDQGGNGNRGGNQAAADPNPGRDEIAPAGPEQYVDITDVEPNGNRGEGGVFSGGSYTVNCGVSDHRNSDNYMAAPGKPNGAQHTHDYVGNTSTNANSDDSSLEAAGTSCTNGDRSTFFWPVLRDLNGTGDDVGQDGGSLDGNVGRILDPQSATLTFSGHGDREIQPLPSHLMIITGNAKQGSQNGANANPKYTCSGFTDRITEQYPICPAGSQLMRILDFPSCWDGQNLESADQRSHMSFPDEQGNCESDQTPIPALRITLTYDQPAGRAFSIDSFPNQQHNPRTDHSDFENLATEAQSQAGVTCIRENQRCPA